MSDQDSSGNRWEPGDQPADQPAAETAAQPAATEATPPSTPAVTEPAGRLRMSRTQAGLAGAGALLLVGGGLGGFFIGHATAGDGHDGRDFPGMGRQGFRDQADGDGRGQMPPGGSGQVPGQNGTNQNGPSTGSGTGQG